MAPLAPQAVAVINARAVVDVKKGNAGRTMPVQSGDLCFYSPQFNTNTTGARRHDVTVFSTVDALLSSGNESAAHARFVGIALGNASAPSMQVPVLVNGLTTIRNNSGGTLHPGDLLVWAGLEGQQRFGDMDDRKLPKIMPLNESTKEYAKNAFGRAMSYAPANSSVDVLIQPILVQQA